MKSTLVILLLTLVGLEIHAQRRITVIDMDSNLPVKDVSVRAGHHQVALTDYLGRADVPIVFDSIAFSHVYYEREQLAMEELGDTMYLLPKEHILPEVRVNAATPEMLARFKGWAMVGAMQGAAEAPGGIASFDFANMLDRRDRRDRKHLERSRKILKEWDKR